MDIVIPNNRAQEGETYQALLFRANGKRYFPRSLLRVWFELYWEQRFGVNTDKHWKAAASNKHIRKAFNHRLHEMEKLGLIRRFDRYIEILENA